MTQARFFPIARVVLSRGMKKSKVKQSYSCLAVSMILEEKEETASQVHVSVFQELRTRLSPSMAKRELGDGQHEDRVCLERGEREKGASGVHTPELLFPLKEIP